MNIFSALFYNDQLLKRAENTINEFLKSGNKNHTVYCRVENPDGTMFDLQPGFKLVPMQFIFPDKKKSVEEWSSEENA
ncbi:MAG TPA: hypothetical protein DCW90_03555 [Lachnospiraceae bacterium]|nr:hypothetical protein [Lachnospiraceae bacterium]